MPATFLTAFTPDADALLARICAKIDETMLGEIAAADRGMDADKHLAALRPLRDRQEFPPFTWHPREVLELIRWSEPDRPKWRPGGQGARGHWMRAFACCALLRLYAENDNIGHCYSFNETLIQLTLSLDRLDARLDREATAFLAWCVGRYESEGDGDEMAFFGLALLWFALRLDSTRDETVLALCRWIDEQEKRLANSVTSRGGTMTRWLLDSNVHALRNEAWAELGSRLADLDLARRAPPARDYVRLLGSALAGEERFD